MHTHMQTARIFTVGNGKELQCIDTFKGPVLSCAFTVDSLHAIAGSSTGQLVISEVGSGKAVQRVENAHAGKINHMSAAPDGKLLATGGSDKVCKVWQLSGSGRWACIKTLKLADEVNFLLISMYIYVHVNLRIHCLYIFTLGNA